MKKSTIAAFVGMGVFSYLLLNEKKMECDELKKGLKEIKELKGLKEITLNSLIRERQAALFEMAELIQRMKNLDHTIKDNVNIVIPNLDTRLNELRYYVDQIDLNIETLDNRLF